MEFNLLCNKNSLQVPIQKFIRHNTQVNIFRGQLQFSIFNTNDVE